MSNYKDDYEHGYERLCEDVEQISRLEDLMELMGEFIDDDHKDAARPIIYRAYFIGLSTNMEAEREFRVYSKKKSRVRKVLQVIWFLLMIFSLCCQVYRAINLCTFDGWMVAVWMFLFLFYALCDIKTRV